MSGRVGRILLLGAALVLWAAPAGPARASNDPGFGRQWGLTQIGAPNAWGRATGAGVKVGIVDTGIDLAHEDLAGAVVASTACLNTDGSPAQCGGSAQDDDGHGTHVAGIVGARKDNGTGVAGVAPGAQLVVARALVHYEDALGEGAEGSTTDINAAIKWVVDRGARVVNLSLGPEFVRANIFGSGLTDGVNYAWSKGAVPVLAAGNTNYFGLGSSNYGNVNALVVGATGPNGEVSRYSSSLGNAKWGLVAPGGNAGDCEEPAQAPDCVLSTFWEAGQSNRYAFLQGTSMAAPHVSGALADVFQANPGFSAQQAVDRILGTLAKTSCGTSCKGRLDVANAVGAGATPPPVGGGGGGTSGGTSQGGGGRSAPPRQGTATTRGGPSTRAPAVAGATVPPGGETTTTTQPDALPANDYTLGSGELGGPEAAPVRIRPDDDSDNSVPAGLGALGAMGVLGAGGAAAFVIRARGGASAVLEALRPGAGP